MIHVPSLAEMKGYVRQVLCARADLDPLTPLLELLLLRRHEPCGIEYTLLAPRSVRLSAIWDSVASRILFYDQNLERFQVTGVVGPKLAELEHYTLERPKLKSIWKGK